MYKLDLPIDRKEAMAIERRRNQEEQRKSRIFNAKTRQIGIDQEALEQQIKDRKQIEEMEKKRNEAYDSDMLRNGKIAEMLQARQDSDLKELNVALNEFRMMHQQPSGRREFDLYDPEGLKKDKPARVSDDDPRCGISSLQKFDGEDLNSKARQKFQEEQRRAWADQQTREREDAINRQKMADKLYELKAREMDARAMELQLAEEECRRAVNQATKDYNSALLREQTAQQLVRKRQEEDDKMTEMANHLYGDFLTENPAAAQSAFGPHRVIPDRWKGMTPEQLADIRRQQSIQIMEAQRLKDEEKRMKEEADRQLLAATRAATLIEREQDRRQKDINRQLAEENLRLAQEQKANRNYIEKDVYTNQPTAAYFMQFNTSSR